MNALNSIKSHYKTFLIVTAIIISLGIGRFSSDVITFDAPKNNSEFNKPLSYNEVSTAINERNEILLLYKGQSGYKVMTVISDSVAAGIAHSYYSQKYPAAK